MKHQKQPSAAFAAIFLCVGLLMMLCACGQTTGSSTAAESDADTTSDAEILVQAWRDVAWYHYDPVEVSHREDYVIEWEDAGMEAHIRFLLDQPEGDIYHSDVWDIQVLAIRPGNGLPHDVLLEQPAEGYDDFCYELICWDNDVRCLYGQESFPDITSLSDLRHFDSLQIFEADFQATTDLVIDLSGIEECQHLKKLRIDDAQVVSLEPLSGMDSLEMLYLNGVGSIDLTPIENLPALTKVSLNDSEIASLEPLTTLPQLLYLSIGFGTTYPDLEPLERTTVKYLDMKQDVYGRELFGDMDYSPLTRMPNLAYLDLTNNMQTDIALCEAILSGSPELEYFIIDYTPAADALCDGTAELDTGSLTAFSALES
ncbi:MAG: hypothetical protein LUE61_06145 [Clostridiales bacterium]|nr:hypothetical protein [Clostridiales bacterium]